MQEPPLRLSLKRAKPWLVWPEISREIEVDLAKHGKVLLPSIFRCIENETGPDQIRPDCVTTGLMVPDVMRREGIYDVRKDVPVWKRLREAIDAIPAPHLRTRARQEIENIGRW